MRPAARTVIMVYIGRTPLLGWSVVTLSRISFISTVETAGTSWMKGEKLETLLFFMALKKGVYLGACKKQILKENAKYLQFFFSSHKQGMWPLINKPH